MRETAGQYLWCSLAQEMLLFTCNDDEYFSLINGLALFNMYLLDDATYRGGQIIFHLHRLKNYHCSAFLDECALLNGNAHNEAGHGGIDGSCTTAGGTFDQTGEQEGALIFDGDLEALALDEDFVSLAIFLALFRNTTCENIVGVFSDKQTEMSTLAALYVRIASERSDMLPIDREDFVL